MFPGDVINRSLLFGEDIRKEGQMSGQKILTILIKYGHKMEATLAEMRKLLPRPVEAGPSQPTVTPPPQPSEKSVPTYEELQEKVAAFVAVEQLVASHLSSPKPQVQVKLPSVSPAKGKETESRTAAASSEPTSEKGSSRRKQKEVTPEARKAVELSDSTTSKEEEEEETPLMDRREDQILRKEETTSVQDNPST